MYRVSKVAPLVGAWIEIMEKQRLQPMRIVAPLVGAWIEMARVRVELPPVVSLLSWERGLKYGIKAVTKSVGNGRSSRGSVD